MLESGAFSVRGDSRPLCHSTSWSSPFLEDGGVEAILEVINGFFIFLTMFWMWCHRKASTAVGS